MKYFLILIAGWIALAGCQPNSSKVTKTAQKQAFVNDPHSHARPNEAVVKHLRLELEVLFDRQVLKGKASWDIETSAGADTLILDIHHLQIEKVTVGELEEPAEFSLGSTDEILGQSLCIPLKEGTKSIQIHYQTTEASHALQWLSPEQTSGKQHPFLYTQSQAILARSWVPVQDSPGIRFTYEATVKVPSGYMALMSARNPQQITEDGIYHFVQPKPIPAYLLALSAGVIEFKSLGERCGVYAEPEVLKQAVYELEDMEKMLLAAEALYGPYAWERYDVLILPPSFPFGGMENPMLTFATPTILAGDRSLTSLIAHEMAHSWSGNLVTNATWNDFWLNEGFTVYFERRIMESVYGKEYANMLAVLGHNDLTHTLEQLESSGEIMDSRLKLSLEGRDPDDGVSDIAYEKGYALLVSLEKRVGRKRWDAFLNRWFSEHAFTSVTTEQFVDFVHEHLFRKGSDWDRKSRLNEWIYEPGLPENYLPPVSARLDSAASKAKAFLKGTPASSLNVKDWSSHEWQYFLRQIKDIVSAEEMKELDGAFQLTATGNSEIAVLWLEAAILHQYQPAYPAVEAFLMKVGRRKFLVPLYSAMQKSTYWNNHVKEIYNNARSNYHAVSRKTLDEMLY
jgi:aminopeptidase N